MMCLYGLLGGTLYNAARRDPIIDEYGELGTCCGSNQPFVSGQSPSYIARKVSP